MITGKGKVPVGRVVPLAATQPYDTSSVRELFGALDWYDTDNRGVPGSRTGRRVSFSPVSLSQFGFYLDSMHDVVL